MIGVVQETLLLCPCCSGQTEVLPCHIAHHRLRVDEHYNRDIAITSPAQLLSFQLPCPYLTDGYNIGVRPPPCVFQMWVKLLCVPPHQIVTFISVFKNASAL